MARIEMSLEEARQLEKLLSDSCHGVVESKYNPKCLLCRVSVRLNKLRESRQPPRYKEKL